MHWPISGPVFLAVYATLLAAAGAAIALTRRFEECQVPEVDPAGLDWYEVALLSGGEELAVTVALTNLRSTGALDLGDGLVREAARAQGLDLERANTSQAAELGVAVCATATRALPAAAHPVERCIHDAVVSTPRATAESLRADAPAMPALGEVRRRLEALGLLRDDERRARLARQWRWFLPLLSLGVVRVGDGLSRGRPVDLLVMLLGATVMAMVATAGPAPATWRGGQALRQLRESFPRPTDRSEIPAIGVVTAITLFGTSLLWSVDPALAVALAAPRPRAGGDGCGGCGGCGGCD